MTEDLGGKSCKFGSEAATASCGRCGAPFCDAHGRDGLCRDCRSPLSVVPSGRLYRGSLITVAVAAVLGIWALLAPPSLPGEHRKAASAAQNPTLVQPQPRQSNAASAVPTVNPFSPTATPPVVRNYTVAFGDTLAGIAQSFATTVGAIEDANPGVTPATLKAGQQLLIPPPPTPTPSATPTPSPSPTPSPTPSPSPTPTPTTSPSPTPTPAPTETPTPTPAPASATPTAAPSGTPAQ